MNEETLSALLDGECSPAELDLLLRQMNQDPATRQRFARLALGQEIRRGIRVPDIPADFADKVVAALPERPDPAAARPTLVPLAPRRSWQPLAGLAAAAAVGAVAVLVMKPDPAPMATTAVPVAQAEPQPEADTALADQDARQLRNYVMAYSQSRARHGMGGTLGYARYAAHTGDDPDGDR
jgi:negative regulator of sigma E activity